MLLYFSAYHCSPFSSLLNLIISLTKETSLYAPNKEGEAGNHVVREMDTSLLLPWESTGQTSLSSASTLTSKKICVINPFGMLH